MLRTRIGLMTYLAPKGTLSMSTATELLKESVEVCLAENEINLVIDMGNAKFLAPRQIARTTIILA